LKKNIQGEENMPIKGLTKRGASFPEIGRIRKGAPKGKNKPGEDLDHFRFVFDEAEVETEVRFRDVYGEEPREFRALLPFDEIEECWSAWLEAYVASGLVYRSDGEKVIFWVDPGTGERKVFQGEPETECVAAKGKPIGVIKNTQGQEKEVYATAHGRLRVIVADLKRFAFMTLVTSSQYDIANIDSQLEGVEMAAKVVGRDGIAGVPLLISRRKVNISVPMSDGKRRRKANWLINIEADPRWAEAQAIAMIEAATPTLVEGRYIEPPEREEDLSLLPVIKEDGSVEWEDNEPDVKDVEVVVKGSLSKEEAQLAKSVLDDAESASVEELEAAGEILERVTEDALQTKAYDLRAYLQGRVIDFKGTNRNTKSLGEKSLFESVNWMLSECWLKDKKADEKRRSVVRFLFGKDTQDMTGAECRALLEFLNVSVNEEGHWKPDPTAVGSIFACLTVAMAESGQPELVGDSG
jgi:hypothetical protein